MERRIRPLGLRYDNDERTDYSAIKLLHSSGRLGGSHRLITAASVHTAMHAVQCSGCSVESNRTAFFI